MGRHEWGLKADVPKYVVINFLQLEDGFFSFLSEKGLFLMSPVKRNTAHCVLGCAASWQIYTKFVTSNS